MDHYRQRHCGSCNKPLTDGDLSKRCKNEYCQAGASLSDSVEGDDDNIECTNDGFNNVPNRAAGRKYCHQCANIDQPICHRCDYGHSCSMCCLVGPQILKEGSDSYIKNAAPRCRVSRCPIYVALDQGDRCLACWEQYANTLADCDVWDKHEVWKITVCGHEVCESLQSEMLCAWKLDLSAMDCGVCKKILIEEEEAERQRISKEQIEADVPLVKELLGQLQSNSAKVALKSWLREVGEEEEEESEEVEDESINDNGRLPGLKFPALFSRPTSSTSNFAAPTWWTSI